MRYRTPPRMLVAAAAAVTGGLVAAPFTAGTARAAEVAHPAHRSHAATAGPMPAGGVDHEVNVTRFCGDRSFYRAPGSIVGNGVFGSNVFQCVHVLGHADGFQITRSHQRGLGWELESFPRVDIGYNIFGVGTSDDPFPSTMGHLRGMTVSVSTHWSQRRRQVADDASDMPITAGPLDGPAAWRAELMLWLHWSPRVAVGTLAAVRACGVTWDLNWWVTGGTGTDHWNYLQARDTAGQSGLQHCEVGPILRFFETHDLAGDRVHPGGHAMIRLRWRPAGMEWGFECWLACRGDAVRSYTVSISSERR
jgi:hypothetical protein